MCNRIAIPSSAQLKAQFPDLNIQDFDANYHSMGYDHEMVPILTNLDPKTVQMARWGYLPPTAKSPDDLKEYDTLNARSESLFSSRLYGEAAAGRRCIIFINGFFEFKHRDGIKYPHYISKEDGTTFTFGGIWSEWNGMLTCSIITTGANALLSDIHNQKLRMPLVLDKSQWDTWLDMSLPQSSVEQLMQPYPVEDLIAWQVSGLLTQRGIDKNTPDIIKPTGPSFGKAPFPDPLPLPAKETKAKPKATKPPKNDPPQLGLF